MHFGVALGAGKPAAFRTAQEGKQRTAAAGGQRGIGEEYRALAKHAPANVRQPLLSTTLAAANRQCMAVPGGRRFGVRALHWRLALAAGQHRLAVPSGMGSIGVSTAPFTIQIVRRLGLLVVASPSLVASHPTNLNTARIRLRP